MDRFILVSSGILVGVIVFVSGIVYGAINKEVNEHEIQCDGFYFFMGSNNIVVGDTSYGNVNSDVRYSNGTLKFTTTGEFNYYGYVIMAIGPIITGIVLITSIIIQNHIEQRKADKKFEEE